MISIRTGLIRLGFCRTMYTENKQDSVEGIYDGIYNNTIISLEIFANGYIARIENSSTSHSKIEIESSASPKGPEQLIIIPPPICRSPVTAKLYREELALSKPIDTRNIRSEVLTMQDILHSLEKLTTNLQIKEQPTPQ